MPTPAEMTTPELLADTDQYAQSQGLAAIIAELKLREIKANDDDDSTQHRGGIRPYHLPLVG